ncbi:predicted protein, partial [Thalassiosira pseudonana CCMP1335]
RVAIIGAGVSGLATAWHLHAASNNVDVHIFESDTRLGGHAHTLTLDNEVDIDCGFMVYNPSNYPNMTAWFKELNIEGEDTDMSLSVSLDEGKTVEWSSHSISGLLFANPKQCTSPKFYTFLKDLMHFNAHAGELLLLPTDHPSRQRTIKEYLTQQGYSDAFASYYLLPMMAALWSASVENVMDFPASSLVEFMCNHKMLQLFNRPQYQTPKGRSVQYTRKMAEVLGENAHTGVKIVGMKKFGSGGGDGVKYELFTDGNESVGVFDHVVFACHSPQALDILKSDGNGKDIDATLLEALEKIEYGDNVVYVHSDPNLMPKSRKAWGSWNCMGKTVYVTYYINRLQNLSTSKDIFVSLNPHTPPKEEFVYRRQIMAHPQFTHQTHEGRETIKKELQGKNGLWFCGAYMGYGFHEDGCRSGFEVATAINGNNTILRRLKRLITRRIPIAICKAFVTRFLKAAITKGELQLKLNDGTLLSFGDKSPCGDDAQPVKARVFDDWFFVKIATEYDLGLARSYIGETNGVIGDPIGLTRLFLLFVGNRDTKTIGLRSSKQHTYSNALQNASGLAISKIGSFINYLRFKIFMDNSERGGSLKNIHAHYDLSNDLFRTFLDKETLMYSSAIYDAMSAAPTEAQWRKLDTLCDRAQLQPGQTLLDIGFGWGGLSLHAAKKYGCRVTGITLSVEQKALAEERVEKEGLGHLINFEVVDYRTFARRKENSGKFDRVISCEMIEAVGHEHLGEFYWAVEQVLKYDGVLVMEAITTPESRYETYIRSTDFINTVIFPGGICPSLHALVDASYKWSTLTLEHIDNIGLHYAETLAEWRRRFNANEASVRKMGFDDVFMRVWNYYMTYCEAGFRSQTEHCLILVFSRPGNRA